MSRGLRLFPVVAATFGAPELRRETNFGQPGVSSGCCDRGLLRGGIGLLNQGSGGEAKRVEASRFRAWARVIFAWVFLTFWISGVTAASTGAACGTDRWEGAKTLRFCTISLVASRGFELFPIQNAMGAFLHLERGIALAQLERDEEARVAFVRAIENVRGADGPMVGQLRQRMDRVNDPHAVALW